MNASEYPQSLFKDVFGLGQQVQVFAKKNAARWRGVIIGIIFSGGGFASFLIGGFYVLYSINKFGPAVRDRSMENYLIPAVMIGLTLLVIGLLTLFSTYRNWKLAAGVYRDGFALSDNKGLHVFRWQDIQSLTSAVTKHYRNGIYTGTTHLYTIIDRQGKKAVLKDSLPKVEEIAKAIDDGIFPHLYKWAADRYNTGAMVAFGPVSISKTGITVGKNSYQWDAVGQIKIESGYLKIAQKDGKWFSGASMPVSGIPNFRVLVSILSQTKGIS